MRRVKIRLVLFMFLISFYSTCCSQQPEEDIVLVNVEHLDRAGIAKEIVTLNALAPKVLAIDLIFDVSKHDDQDAELASALWECKHVVLADLIHTLGDKVFIGSASQAEFTSPKKRTGFVNLLQENDSHETIKRFNTREQERYINRVTGKKKVVYHFGISTAMAYDSIKAMNFLNTHSKIVDIDYKNGKRKFKKYSSQDLFSGQLTRRDIEGKIVLLSFLGPGNEDKFYTPLNKDPKNPDMYGAEYLANIVAQVLEWK